MPQRPHDAPRHRLGELVEIRSGVPKSRVSGAPEADERTEVVLLSIKNLSETGLSVEDHRQLVRIELPSEDLPKSEWTSSQEKNQQRVLRPFDILLGLRGTTLKIVQVLPEHCGFGDPESKQGEAPSAGVPWVPDSNLGLIRRREALSALDESLLAPLLFSWLSSPAVGAELTRRKGKTGAFVVSTKEIASLDLPELLSSLARTDATGIDHVLRDAATLISEAEQSYVLSRRIADDRRALALRAARQVLSGRML
jgi:hypothetical protein